MKLDSGFSCKNNLEIKKKSRNTFNIQPQSPEQISKHYHYNNDGEPTTRGPMHLPQGASNHLFTNLVSETKFIL